jgi:outer membrane protein
MGTKWFGRISLIVLFLLVGWGGEIGFSAPVVKGSEAKIKGGKENSVSSEKDRSKAKKIVDVRLEKRGDFTDFTIIGDGEIGKYETLRLGSPTRFVIDVKNVALRFGKTLVKTDDSVIKEVRIGRHPDKVRFVVYPRGKEIPSFEIKPEREGLRIAFGSFPKVEEKGVTQRERNGKTETQSSAKTDAVSGRTLQVKVPSEPPTKTESAAAAKDPDQRRSEVSPANAEKAETAPSSTPAPKAEESPGPIRMSIKDLGPQPAPPEAMTLEEAIKIALERNLRIHTAKEQVRASEFRTKAAFTDFLPKWTAQYAYTHYSKPVLIDYVLLSKKDPLTGNLVSVPGTDRDVFSLGSGASLPLFTGGALSASYQLEKLGVDISKWNVDIATLDIVLQARINYFNILTAGRAIEVARQAVRQFESQLEVSKAFFEVGIVAKNDVLQAEVRLANAVQALVTAENALALTKASFNTLLRRPIDTPVQVVDILEYKPHAFRFEEAVEEALRQRPEIKAAQLTVEQAKEAVKIAKAGFYPTVSLGGSYSTSSEEPSLLGELRGHNWSAQAVASFTIFEWGKTAYKVAESKVKVNQAEDAKTQIVEQIVLEVKQNYLNMLNAEKNIGVAQKSLEQAEENLRINEERYKNQVATQTEVLDAVALLAQARQNYYLALSAYNIAKAQLERSMGRTKILS